MVFIFSHVPLLHLYNRVEYSLTGDLLGFQRVGRGACSQRTRRTSQPGSCEVTLKSHCGPWLSCYRLQKGWGNEPSLKEGSRTPGKLGSPTQSRPVRTGSAKYGIRVESL